MSDVILVNGSKEIRVRNSESCTVLPCQCAHTDVMWLQMCRPHFEEDLNLHAEAQTEHMKQELTT
jgi:hypothetical protein